MNITCPKCRASVSETALVCPACGYDFMPAPPTPPSPALRPFGPTPFGASSLPGLPGAGPPTAPQGGESDGIIAMVLATVGLVACVPLALPALFLGLRARARAAEQGRSTTLGTLAIVLSLIACVVWAVALIYYQRLLFPAPRVE